MKKRIEWVDIGKYICIMFVMLSHLESRTEALRLFYTPFFLTVFFFLSGYVYTETPTFKEHFIKKVNGLLIPWFILSNISIVMSAIMSFKSNHTFVKDFVWNLIQIRGMRDGMWFVAALFVAYIPFYFVIKMNNRNLAIMLSIFLLIVSNIYTVLMPTDFFPWRKSALPWHIEFIFKAMIWMVLGYYYRNDFEKNTEKYNKWAVLAVSLVVYILLVYYVNPESIALDKFLLYIKSCLGIIITIMICKRVKTNKYIAYVGANTLVFFAFHGKVFAVLEHILHVKAGVFYRACLNNTFYSSVLAFVITIILSFILIIPAYIINRWFPWMIGRNQRGSMKMIRVPIKVKS